MSVRRTSNALLLLGILAVLPCLAGTITNNTMSAGPLSFTSTWTWTMAGGDWLAGPVTANGGVGTWEVTLTGNDATLLTVQIDHLMAPHPDLGEIVPGTNTLTISGIFGPGFATGSVTASAVHPNAAELHHDITIAWDSSPLGTTRTITVSGVHTPEPASFGLLCLGAFALAAAARIAKR